MKHTLRIIPALLCAVLLSACAACTTPAENTPPPTETTIPQTDAPGTLPPETETPTQPEHSSLYIPGPSVEEVILYFNEVCLDAEYVNSGNPGKIQKWDIPIYYTLNGEYTPEDLQTLAAFTAWLNTIEGFPGIFEIQDAGQANLRIYFRDQDGLADILGEQLRGNDGGVTFWYQEDAIYDAIICYSTETDQQLRKSVILEELYNSLGPIQDTALRPDSIIYAKFSQPQALTEIDELILRLLYHPDIKCGMDAAECEARIRELYY